MKYDKTYWDEQYSRGLTGWDVGYVCTPIKEYVDQLNDKSDKILIPGAGNSYEAEYLFKNGFTNVFILEFAEEPILNLLKRIPDFPESHIIKHDFFDYEDQFDLIIEHTFFSSLHPSTRSEYVNKAANLLKEKGKLVGILFGIDFGKSTPPFGGNEQIYRALFESKFSIKTIETSYNSIKPRANNELFIIFEKN